MKREISIKSGQEVLKGLFITPDSGNAPFPLVVMAGGWCYVKEIVLPQYAEEMLSRGMAVLMFDFRCLGESTGEPRQHLDPVAQIEDYRNVISFSHTLPEIDHKRIAAWGISYSGGHVLALAAIEPRISAAVSIIPVIDGYRTMQLVQGHRNDRLERLNAAILEDRVTRYTDGERAYIPHNSMTPDTELCTWPFTSSNKFFSRAKATFASRYENRSTLESTEMLMNYSVLPYLERILGLPVHMTVVEGDTHTPWEVQIEGYNRIPSPRKEITLLQRVSHIGLYSEKSNLVRAAIPGAEFLARQFALGG